MLAWLGCHIDAYEQAKWFGGGSGEAVHGRGDFGELDQVATWDAVMSKAPTASRELSPDELDQALAASADFGDLESPYTLGHSRAVAELAAAAAGELGANTRTVRMAGLPHDLGRMGVPNTIWDKRAADRRRGRTGAVVQPGHGEHVRESTHSRLNRIAKMGTPSVCCTV